MRGILNKNSVIIIENRNKVNVKDIFKIQIKTLKSSNYYI